VVKARKGAIKVMGKGKEFFWVCHALERSGLRISKESEVVVTALEGKWQITTPEREQVHQSIDDVLIALNLYFAQVNTGLRN
jgi:hypothetical protein